MRCAEFDARFSGIVWAAMFASLAFLLILQRLSGLRAFCVIAIIRSIISLGLQPTLLLLGLMNVRRLLTEK